MIFQRFRSNLVSAQWGSRLWLVVATTMMLSNLLLVVYLLGLDSREKTIVVPPNLERPFTVQGEEVSQDYLIQLGEWFSALALSYTPKSIEYRRQLFLRYAAPESYSALKSEFESESQRIKRNEMSALFFPVDARVKGLYVAITGDQVQRVGKEVVGEKRVTYRLQLRLSGGFPHIIEFIEVDREKPFSTAHRADSTE